MDAPHKALSQHRLAQAKQCLNSAEVLLNIDDYNGSANRSYYAVFHAMRSILALEIVDFKKHSAVISYFRKNYIKTGLLPIAASVIIGKAFDMRSDGDYDDDCELTKDEAKELLEDVKLFYEMVESYLKAYILK